MMTVVPELGAGLFAGNAGLAADPEHMFCEQDEPVGHCEQGAPVL
jgi:hypothetical protein